MNPLHRILGSLLLLLLVVILASGCYAPSETDGSCVGNTYRACVEAQAAVHILGLCNQACQADCRARAVGACP